VEIVMALSPGPDVDIAPLIRDDETWAVLVEFWASVVHPDFRCTATLLGSETSYGTGADAIRAFYLDWMAPWVTYRVVIEEARDLGDRIVLLVTDYGRRKGTAEEIKGRNASVWSFSDGKIIRFDAYSDQDDALKAVGLEE
jgi:hypothetical protein